MGTHLKPGTNENTPITCLWRNDNFHKIYTLSVVVFSQEFEEL